MRRTRGSTVQIESEAELARRLALRPTSLDGWRIRGVDLAGHIEALDVCRLDGATFIGCTAPDDAAVGLRARGALVVPEQRDLPLDPDRAALYTAAELYDTVIDGGSYAASLDARGYAWTQRLEERDVARIAALHDHAIDAALRAWVDAQAMPVVGVMGGHALARGTVEYADAVTLGRLLGGGHVVATGGGPGAMEASNLGARLAHLSDDVTDYALERLAQASSFRPSVDAWVLPALQIAAEAAQLSPVPAHTLGVPTWHYGHEPPNAFATAIAKYVGNAVREAVLLEICGAGIVVLPGAAGTVQEIFQDACENYYADESSVAPMVLVGRKHWTETLPAWPLLQSLARGRAMEAHVHLVDDVHQAAELIRSQPPRATADDLHAPR
ncbi:LOG family protein [Nocardioides sp. R-C-SC26]|uniref:LOG family protein n=1 Tax=Nocardioides sp. R-C-SC26 TaxID=2870414 RepID=UPI001E571C7F|nr:LOG family protein [Nocardioides sp. R-C-SC26]